MENRRMLQKVLEQVNQVILGKEQENREILLAFLAWGNVLLEDIPGVGRTTLALAFSRAMGLEHRRVQFTPDVLPSDLTGFSIYRRETETFVYQPGSVFCNLLLADELNRTSPKTQSALLEVMEEGQVTVEGVTRAVPKPFLVIATQNPAGTAGTQPLPEAQVDRFLTSLSLGYPDPQSELSLALSPMGEDVVEDFLFEKHSSYCVHYASAAVLLYRLYGIPAQYAAGYLVPPEEFSPGEDGNWTAAVTDEAAHAWAEIFLPDHGWTPVEVTPNSQGEMEVYYPGFTWSSSHLPQWEPAPAFEGGERPEVPVAFDSPSRGLWPGGAGAWRGRFCP